LFLKMSFKSTFCVLIVYVLIAQCFISVESLPAPGMKVVLGTTGLASIISGVLPYVSSLAGHLSIGDVNGSASVPIVGTVIYNVTEIRLTDLFFGPVMVQTDPSTNAIVALINDVEAEIDFDWHYRTTGIPRLDDHGKGSGKTEGSGVSARGTLTISATPDTGIPVLKVTSLSVDLGKLAVKLTSSSGSVVSWFETLFAETVVLALTRTIEKAVATSGPAAINAMIKQELDVQPYQMVIAPGLGLDYSFTGDAVVTSDAAAIPIAGELYPPALGPHSTPGKPGELPDKSLTPQTLEIYASQWSVGSALRAAFISGELTAAFTSESVPETSPLQPYFHTSAYAAAAPGMAAVFGNNSEVAVVIAADSAPEVSIEEGSFSIIAPLRLEVVGTDLKDGKRKQAFRLGIDPTISGNLAVNGDRVVGKIAVKDGKWKVVESAVGEVDAEELDKDFTPQFQATVLLYINNKLAQGFPIPSLDGFSLVDPIISFKKGAYVLLSADLKYVPPK